MHPLLRDPRRLAIYLATWAVVGTLFASMVAVTRQIPLSVAVLVVIPLLLIQLHLLWRKSSNLCFPLR